MNTQTEILTRADCDLVFRLVHRHTGVLLKEGKEYLVATRLQPVVALMGMRSISEIATALRAGPNHILEDLVVQSMVTTETSFFRDIHPFESLRTRFIPELIRRNATRRTLNIWSAGCSSGQEAYSIAMVIREHFPELSGWSISILATDVSTWMLDRGRAGVYGQLEINRGLPANLMVRFFHRDGVHWRIDDSIREMVTFEKVNLLGDWPPLPPLDIIFLRNVLIYFDIPTKEKIFARVRSVLHPEGYMLLGGAETPMMVDNGFERIPEGPTMWYQKKDSTLRGFGEG